MTKTVYGRTIELSDDLGLAEEQEVEVHVRTVRKTSRKSGEGFLRTEGALADDTEWDAIMEEVYQARKLERRLQVADKRGEFTKPSSLLAGDGSTGARSSVLRSSHRESALADFFCLPPALAGGLRQKNISREPALAGLLTLASALACRQSIGGLFPEVVEAQSRAPHVNRTQPQGLKPRWEAG